MQCQICSELSRAWDTCIYTHCRAVTHSQQSESFPIQTFIARLDRGNPNRQNLLMLVYGHFKIQFLIFSSEYGKQDRQACVRNVSTKDTYVLSVFITTKYGLRSWRYFAVKK